MGTNITNFQTAKFARCSSNIVLFSTLKRFLPVMLYGAPKCFLILSLKIILSQENNIKSKKSKTKLKKKILS